MTYVKIVENARKDSFWRRNEERFCGKMYFLILKMKKDGKNTFE